MKVRRINAWLNRQKRRSVRRWQRQRTVNWWDRKYGRLHPHLAWNGDRWYRHIGAGSTV